MTEYAANVGGVWPLRSATRDQYVFSMKCPIGSAGAVGTIVKNDGALGLTNSTTGTFAMTFPKSPGNVFVEVGIKSAAGTVSQWYLSAIDAAAGTATLLTLAPGGSAANPADGDVLYITIREDTRSD